jgi:hypothetical protein
MKRQDLINLYDNQLKGLRTALKASYGEMVEQVRNTPTGKEIILHNNNEYQVIEAKIKLIEEFVEDLKAL